MSAERIKELVTSIHALKHELRRLADKPDRQRLNPPASPQAIDAAEKASGITFPADYRAFLALHDGWHGFSGDNELLSTEQLLGGETADWILKLKSWNPNTPLAHGVAIMGSPLTASVLFFDPATRRPDNGMDVVHWHDGEGARYPSFTEFLETWAQGLERNVARERARLRKT